MSPLFAAGLPRPDHVVIVMEENHSYSLIIGSSDAPHINSLAEAGALFTDSHAIEHPSQPNYLDLFSGSNQGVTNNTCPHAFSTANLAQALIDAGFTFGGYSEDLPSTGYTGCRFDTYVRRHNPWVNFTNVPAAANMPFTSWPSDFTKLPTVSFVVPNLDNDMHNGTIRQADTWLEERLQAYRQWAMTHNSLLIVTWDEDDRKAENHIVTIFLGPMVRPGRYAKTIDHFNVLRTLTDMYGLPPLGKSADAAPITEVWTSNVQGPDCNGNDIADALDIASGASKDENRNTIPDECEIHFRRGDPNADGGLDIGDTIFLLNFLFLEGSSPSCMESADFDNDGAIDLADALLFLNLLFLGGPPAAEPGPGLSPCGIDPDTPGSPGDLGCDEYSPCEA